MLPKSKISGIPTNTEQWLIAKLGKFSSSEIYKLMGEDGLGVAGMTYIREKVHEELTGEPIREDVDTDDMRWGHLYEPEAVSKLQTKMLWEFIVTQQLITEPGSRFGSTPDALRLISESPDGSSYEVENIEIKCPPKNYIILFLCKTPKELKAVSKKFYWQVVDQADNCGALKSHFVAYHPKFRMGNMRHIEFDFSQPVIDKNGKKTFPLFNDLKLLRERKKEAELKFIEIRDQLLQELPV